MISGETLFIGSFDKNLYALDTNNGTEIWRYEAGGGIATTPLIQDNTIYFGSFDRYVYAVNAGDGSLTWKSEFEAGSWYWATPLAYHGMIYAPNIDGKVYILNASSGTLVETIIPRSEQDNQQLSLIRSSPVLFDGSVIFASEEGKVYILDTTDNSVEELYDVGETVYAPLIVNDSILYIHTQDETLIAFDMAQRMKLWDYP